VEAVVVLVLKVIETKVMEVVAEAHLLTEL
jgi:hypothetical protein